MSLDVADLIESFAADAPNGGRISGVRRAKTTYVNGIAVAGATTPLEIIFRSRPASGRDLQRLPEGRRTEETRVGDTTTELYAGGQAAPFEADLLDIDGDGRLWEVQQVQRWPVAVIDRLAYTVTLTRPAASNPKPSGE